MPRNSSGIYSLPGGNPVVTLTVISSAWANTTMSDLSTAMTDSLDRSGFGAMLAGLQLFDGAIGAPGLTWGTQATAGLYRAGTSDFRWAIGGVDIFTIGVAGLTAIGFGQVVSISGNDPRLKINEADGAANNRLWDIAAVGEQLRFRTDNDADNAFVNWLTVDRTLNVIDAIAFAGTAMSFNGILSLTKIGFSLTSALQIVSNQPCISFTESDGAANNKNWYAGASAEAFFMGVDNDAGTGAVDWIQVQRTATTIDSVNFPNGILQYGGNEVGYRNFVRVAMTGNLAATDAHRGKLVLYTGAGGHAYSIASAAISDDGAVTIVNFSASTLSITVSGGLVLNWLTGAGITTGARTLQPGSVCTINIYSSANAAIWGIGLS